jgi:hypothetical protein
VRADNLEIDTASEADRAAGIASRSNGGYAETDVTAETLTITASGAEDASGITAESSNIVLSTDMGSSYYEFSSDEEGNEAWHLSEDEYHYKKTYSSTSTVVSVDSLDIDVVSEAGRAAGIASRSNGGDAYTDVTAETLTIGVSGAEEASGIIAESNSTVLTQASSYYEFSHNEDGTETWSRSEYAYSYPHEAYASTVVSADSLNIEANSEGRAAGIASRSSGGYAETNVEAETLTISASGVEEVSGITAEAVGKEYTETHRESSSDSEGNSSRHEGTYSEFLGAGAYVSVQADSLNIDANSEGRAAGVNAKGDGGDSTVDVTAGELDITVAGDEAYGIAAQSIDRQYTAGYTSDVEENGETTHEEDIRLETRTGEARILVQTASLNITAAGTQHAAGISADGAGSRVEVSSLNNTGMSVIIACAVTENDLKGIALEALNGGHVTITSGYGNDTLDLTGDIVATSAGEAESGISIDAGYGDDTVSLNGKIDVGEDAAFSLSGGEGQDLLILHAPDAETFTEWYKPWFETADINSMSFEQVKVEGADLDAVPWLAELFAVQGVPVTLEGDNSAFYLTDTENLDAVNSFDFGHDDDTLFVKFDGSDSVSALTDNIGDVDKLRGLENLVLDVTDSEDPNAALTGLDTLLGSLDSLGANEPKIFLRVDESRGEDVTTAIQGAGWSTNNDTATLNGVDYQVYTNSSGDEQQLFVALITSGTA